MNLLARLRHSARLASGAAVLLALGCASPGPPRPPSLRLPQPVRDLTASRQGDAVELRFTLPQHTTDRLPLHPPNVWATLCRGLEREPCEPVAARQNQELPIAEANGVARLVLWSDPLPAALTAGPPHALVYRLQLSNSQGRSAGWSAPAETLAGAAPLPVQDLHAEGTPRGILLRWQPLASNVTSPAEVLLQREPISAAPQPQKKKNSANQPIWLATHAETTSSTAAQTLDTSAQENAPYRYIAVRRRLVQLGDTQLEMRSAPSSPVEITLRDIFPPPVPTGLSAAPFSESGQFAIDLVWGPVDDPGLAGYNILRQPIDATGAPAGAAEPLNTMPIALPAFHDATASASQRYRYSVTAVDRKGNVSAAASVIVEPTSAP
jgi:hypothetical protein